MLPIILCSPSEKETAKYIETVVKKNCINTTNIFNFLPEKAEYSMEEIRDILKLFYIQSPQKRLFIFNRFENASWEVQNMLLKLLEEQIDLNIIILITSNVHILLPTIRSRAKTITIRNTSTIAKSQTEIPVLLDFILKEKKRNSLFHEKLFQMKKEDALLNIDDFVTYFSTKLKEKQAPVYTEILKYLFFIKNKIENNNLNVSLAMDNLLLFIEKKISIKV